MKMRKKRLPTLAVNLLHLGHVAGKIPRLGITYQSLQTKQGHSLHLAAESAINMLAVQCQHA
jgi:hypothetical protein